MSATDVKTRRDYVLLGFVSGMPINERVRVLRRVDFGVPGEWVLVRGADGRRFVTHAGHLHAA